jgi:putative membrane protein
MIKRYSDHSANERTYLAWIRTSISIMVFGILIEKLDLFISYIGKKIGDSSVLQPSLYAELIGLGLFLVGIITIVIATIRFFIQEKAIESDESIPYHIKKTNILFSGLMILLATFLFILLLQKIFPSLL